MARTSADPRAAQESVEQRVERRESALGAAVALRESDEERRGDSFMQQHGYVAIRFSQPRQTMQTEGIPDRRYYHAGWRHALWWEAKSSRGKQRTAQRAFQQLCEACGEEYVLGTADVLIAFVGTRLPHFRRRTA